MSNARSTLLASLAFASVLGGGLAASPALATSLHPCTPRVQAQPTYISCRAGDVFYSIQVDTLLSPAIDMCRGKNAYEYKTATVTLSDVDGVESGSLRFFHGEFTYSLSADGDASFAAVDGSLVLDSCVTPSHGAVSFGN